MRDVPAETKDPTAPVPPPDPAARAAALKKRENENLTPGWLTEISEPVSLAQLEAGAGQGFTLDQASTKMLPPRAPDASLNQLDQLMEREPERVAAQVKAWMAED